MKINDQQRHALTVNMVDVLMHMPWTITDLGKQPHDSMVRFIVQPNPKLQAVGPETVPNDEAVFYRFRQEEAHRAKHFFTGKLVEALIEVIERT